MGVLIWLVSFLPILVSSATLHECERCVHNSNASISSNEDSSYWGGTCHYGADQVEFNGVHPVGVMDSILLNGAGFGATYQVRCKDRKKCKRGGIYVIVTTNVNKNEAGFVWSNAALKKLFVENYKPTVKKYQRDGIDVEYKRVPSVYKKNQNMSIRIERMVPNYFAIKVLYQGGQTYIESINMAYRGPEKWIAMNRKIGAVWQVSRTVQAGWDLKFRLSFLEGNQITKYIDTSFVKIIQEYGVYSLGIQLNGTAKEKCRRCDDSTWK